MRELKLNGGVMRKMVFIILIILINIPTSSAQSSPQPGDLISGTKSGDKIFVFNPTKSPAVVVHPEGFVSSSIVGLDQGANKKPELDLAAALQYDVICATKQYRVAEYVNGKRVTKDWKLPQENSIALKMVNAMCIDHEGTRSSKSVPVKPVVNFSGKVTCWALARARVGHGREKMQMVSINGVKGIYRGVPSPAGHVSGATELSVTEVTSAWLVLQGKGGGGENFEVRVNRGTGEYVAVLAPGFEMSKGECAAGENKF